MLPSILRLPPLPHGYAVRLVVALNDALGWCKQGINHLIASGLLTRDQLAQYFVDRSINASTAFSGIGAPETLDAIIANTVREVLGGNTRFHPAFAIEFNAACQEELLSLPHPLDHVFGNILDCLPPGVQVACGLNCKASEDQDAETVMNHSWKCHILTKAWCYKCGRVCSLTPTDKHTAGSPCTGH